MSQDNEEEREDSGGLVLVARKGGFGLPTACPSCLPIYLYLKFANSSFTLHHDLTRPDSDQIPYIEYGDCVLFNNENGGVIEALKRESIVDLDSRLPSICIPDWLSTKAMVSSWLEEAAQYELWVASDGSTACKIYYSDLPWPIGKVLYWKQTLSMKHRFGITNLNAVEKEEEIYRRAALAYEALSLRLGQQDFFFDNRPTSLDALFLGHALFVLHALPDTSVLRSKLLTHDNLVKYADNLKDEFLESNSSSTSIPRPSFGASTSSSSRARTYPNWGSKTKAKAKREKTEEEKIFRKRAKYFLAAQVVSILVFLSLFGGADNAELEDDEDGVGYDD